MASARAAGVTSLTIHSDLHGSRPFSNGNCNRVPSQRRSRSRRRFGFPDCGVGLFDRRRQQSWQAGEDHDTPMRATFQIQTRQPANDDSFAQLRAKWRRYVPIATCSARAQEFIGAVAEARNETRQTTPAALTEVRQLHHLRRIGKELAGEPNARSSAASDGLQIGNTTKSNPSLGSQ